MVDRPTLTTYAKWPARSRVGADWWHHFTSPVACRLSEYFRPALRAHLARLSADDLGLRFGTHARPEVLDAYVAGIDFRESIILGVFGADLDLIGTAHLSPQSAHVREIGLSVVAEWRNRGIGSMLLHRAMEYARLDGTDRIFLHSLTINTALMHMVRKAGAEIIESCGDTDSIISLPAASALGNWIELAKEHLAALDFGVKAQRLMARMALQKLNAA